VLVTHGEKVVHGLFAHVLVDRERERGREREREREREGGGEIVHISQPPRTGSSDGQSTPQKTSASPLQMACGLPIERNLHPRWWSLPRVWRQTTEEE
jgi:hypothetical protein